MPQITKNYFNSSDTPISGAYVFDSIAEAKAANLTVGSNVRTTGYYAANDGGAGEYKVVAGATGTDDGGSYHDMGNGNQLELIKPTEVNPLLFGARQGIAVSQGTFFQNAINYAQANAIPLTGSGRYEILDGDELSIPGSMVIRCDNLNLDYSGNTSYYNTLTITSSTVSGPFMHASGSEGSDSTINSGATKGSTAIISSIPGVSAGDLIKVHSDDTSPGDTTPGKLGELVLVNSVSGTTINLQTPLHDNYTTNPKVKIINPIENLEITGITFIGKGRDTSAAGDLGLFLVRCKDVKVDCKFQSVDQISCDLISCFSWDLRGTFIHDEPGANTKLQYQARCSAGSIYGTVDVKGYGSRHTFNTGNTSQIDGGINRHIDIKASCTGTSGAGVSTHNAASNIYFRDITAIGCDFAIDTREENIRIGKLYSENCRNDIIVRNFPETLFIEDIHCKGGENGILLTSIDATANPKNIMIGKALIEDQTQNGISQSAIGATNRSIYTIDYLKIVNSSSSGGNYAAVRFDGNIDARINNLEIIEPQNFGIRTSETATITVNNLYVKGGTAATFSFGTNAAAILVDDFKDDGITTLESGAGNDLLKIGRRFTIS